MSAVNSYVTALTIAGSDSSGGAGIQADLKIFSALGVYGMSALTALTAQNTCGVKSVFEVSPEFVAEQIDAVFEDIRVDAVKIGMIHRAEIIEKVVDRLAHHRVKNIVLDPVMVAKGGANLLQKNAVDALRALFPLATVLTPNLPEASVLLGRPIQSENEMEAAANDLLETGVQSVLIKGGHLAGEKSSDYLVSRCGLSTWFVSNRIQTQNTHGTGCTLSAAIAARLAHGSDLKSAVAQAKEYLSTALKKGACFQLGKGHGPVHH